VAGDIDMATTGGAVINGILSGADLIYIAMVVPTYGFSLYARPDVKDVTSLKGKVIGVMTKGASSDHAAVALLRHNKQPARMKFLYLAESVSPGSPGAHRHGRCHFLTTTLAARRLGLRGLNIAFESALRS
jgi:hypothetical protein